MRSAVFFDLDGTLLPLDMAEFERLYYIAVKKTGLFENISKTNGKEAFTAAVYAMLRNDGRLTNRDVFFRTIESMSGTKREALMPYLESFYANEFKAVKQCTGYNEHVPRIIAELKKKGFKLILSTNPVFPRIATDQRIAWAGLDPSDFDYISYYDNSSFCKPDPRYFLEVLDKIGLSASECYVVGNDVSEDMGAIALGFKGFLVTDHMIGDLKGAPECVRGSYSDLLEFAKSLRI
jgi:HAD superfamily hydrolase (TIGR01549 family)